MVVLNFLEKDEEIKREKNKPAFFSLEPRDKYISF